MMMTEICQYLRNWFDRVRYFGTFTVKNGEITGFKPAISHINYSLNLVPGQYVRVIGSMYNDGVHRYPDYDMVDETFEGAVWSMAVPREVIELEQKISDWCTKYGDPESPSMSPYSSESFGGYSYSKASGSSSQGTGSGSGCDWVSAYSTQLRQWRKI